MNDDTLRAQLARRFDHIPLYDSFDEALVGVGRRSEKPIPIYDRETLIEVAKREYDLSLEQAKQFVHLNFTAYAGEDAPVVLHRSNVVHCGRISGYYRLADYKSALAHADEMAARAEAAEEALAHEMAARDRAEDELRQLVIIFRHRLKVERSRNTRLRGRLKTVR